MSKQIVFFVSGTSRNAKEFELLASQAERLKKHGEVVLHVGSLTGPTRSDIPPGGSPWHDYTSWLPSLEKLFPHPDLLPFVDREYVKKNQAFFRECVGIIRKHKYGASFGSHAPWYLPEKFWEKYPHLRGPRIDHPRRGRKEAFAMCVDLPEGRAFYAKMFGQLVSELPELRSFGISTNDAGGGFCWADWLYPGPNGPSHCKHNETGKRVRDFIDALRAAAPGKQIEINLRGNWSDVELHSMAHYNDENFHTRPQHGPDTPKMLHLGHRIDNPVLGVISAVALLKGLEHTKKPETTKVGLGFGTNYARGRDLPETIEKVVELVDEFFAAPQYGRLGRMQFLRKMCAKWVGEQQAETLLDAFYMLDEAQEFRAAAVSMFSTNYVGVSMRHINRPLVAIPEKLSPEEEAYWLPHVFNPNPVEARRDYNDFHGGRLWAQVDMDQGDNPRVVPMERLCNMLNRTAEKLLSLTGEGSAEFFRKMGTSLRIMSSIFRSTANFYGAQKVRDRNLEVFAGPEQTPPKNADWVGNRDLQLLNAFMRDELDNTTELIGILESGGISQVQVARDPSEEDTFLLGPGLIDQLKQKCRIMERHWLDIEKYLATPHK